MTDDLPVFLATVGLFILYLCWSAATEMGTKPFRWPGKKWCLKRFSKRSIFCLLVQT